MKKFLLFYIDGPKGERKFDWSWIDKWCAIYGVYPIAIDKDGHYKTKDRPPYRFKSIEDAVNHGDFKDCQWVWLDPKGEKYWDEVELPKNNVVYCLGDDEDGFGGFQHPGMKLRMRPPHPDHDGEWFASMVAPLLLFEVYQR